MRSSRKKIDTVGLISTARFFTRGLLLGCNWPPTVLPPLGGTPTVMVAGGGGLLRAGGGDAVVAGGDDVPRTGGGERGGGFCAVARAMTQHRAVIRTAACRVVCLQPMRVTVHVGIGWTGRWSSRPVRYRVVEYVRSGGVERIFILEISSGYPGAAPWVPRVAARTELPMSRQADTRAA